MQKLQSINNVRIYVISHGRPKPQQRPTCKILDEAGLDYYMVMNEHQVSDYVDNGVDPKKIIVTTDEFEKEYMKDHRIYKVSNGFTGAVPNRERCNIDARENSIKYALQLDDNIVQMYLRNDGIKKKYKEKYQNKMLPDLVRCMRDICDSTNIGMLGLTMGATPTIEKKKIRNGYAYSFFMENVEANIHWRGPFDDDVTHNLDFNHSGKYTNALLTLVGYTKESKSNTGMREAYKEFYTERASGVAALYPDHVKVGVKSKANGKESRIYHVFTGRLHQNIKVYDVNKFAKSLHTVEQYADDYGKELKNE